MKIPHNSRRQFVKISSFGVVGLVLPISINAFSKMDNKEYLVYIGTYTDGSSEGIYLYKLNVSTGELQLVSTTSNVKNPSYLTFDPQKKYLYAVNEVTEFQGKKSGAVSSFAIDQKTGSLSFLNQQPTLGGAPCYVQVDKTGKTLMIANYVGGSVAIYPLLPNGNIGKVSKLIDHNPVEKGEEKKSHAHCIVTDPENKFAFVADLGMDKIYIYQLEPDNVNLKQHTPPAIGTKKGAGPRHFTFHPKGNYAFGINELNSTITSFNYDKKGKLFEIQTVSTLPIDFKGESFCADIHVSPDGKFLYGSNRGHNSIAIFSIDQESGKLVFVDHASTLGNWPRNFAIDPSGSILMVANQKSDDIFTFFINKENGKLTATGKKIELSAPVCLKVVSL